MFTSSCFCKCYFYKRYHFLGLKTQGKPLSELQIHFGVLQINTENSACEIFRYLYFYTSFIKCNRDYHILFGSISSHLKCQTVSTTLYPSCGEKYARFSFDLRYFLYKTEGRSVYNPQFYPTRFVNYSIKMLGHF